MKRSGNRRAWILAVLLCMVILAGCRGAGNDVPQISKEVAEAMEEDEGAAEPLQEENTLPADGIVTKAQMKTIAGKKGTYHFNGETTDGISYQWEYDGEKIQNPIEQKLKVECTTDGVEEIKKAANDAPYGLGVVLEDMGMAAPAKLSLTLKEGWDADKVIYCTYEDGKVYQLSSGEIEEVKDGKENISKISFQVTKAGGTFYVLAGSVQGSPADGGDTKSAKSSAKEEKKGDTSPADQEQAESSASDEGGSSQEGDVGQEDDPVQEQQDGDTDVIQDTGDGQSAGQEEQQTDPKQAETHTCTISIECGTLVGNSDLKPEKAEFVPADGWIVSPLEVTYTPGESVFDVLKRVCGERGIQMESSYTPMYGSYYIEGINQLYEFDGGSRSGWMYSVNGWFPNYGCSSYTVGDGDVIEWKYTCTIGSDVGNDYMGGTQ